MKWERGWDFAARATLNPSPSGRGGAHCAAMGGEGCKSEDKRHAILHPLLPPPSSRNLRKQMSGTQKAQQNKALPGSRSWPAAKPGRRPARFSKELIRPGPPRPHITRILPTGAAPVPFGLWEGRPGGWEAVDVTAHRNPRDVDPGKPDQKAGRESRLARLSSERSRELMVSGQGLAAPKSSRKLPETPGAEARRAKRPHRKYFFPRAPRRPPRRLRLRSQTPTQTRMAPPVRIRTYGAPMAKRRREPRIDYACIAAPEDRAALLRYTGAPEWLIARALRDAPPQALRALGHPQRRRQRTRPISRRRPCPSGAGSRP
jgi:hypothetical protein